MLRTALAAALAAALTSSAARAVEVEYYNASPEWARKMGQYFEEAPAALKSKMFGAHVIVVSDLETLAKVQRRNGSSAADIKKFSESDKYNALAGKAAGGGLMSEKDANLEQYVTGKALDGLYLTIGEEERKIRQDPVGTGSAILKKVFGSLR